MTINNAKENGPLNRLETSYENIIKYTIERYLCSGREHIIYYNIGHIILILYMLYAYEFAYYYNNIYVGTLFNIIIHMII